MVLQRNQNACLPPLLVPAPFILDEGDFRSLGSLANSSSCIPSSSPHALICSLSQAYEDYQALLSKIEMMEKRHADREQEVNTEAPRRQLSTTRWHSVSFTHTYTHLHKPSHIYTLTHSRPRDTLQANTCAIHEAIESSNTRPFICGLPPTCMIQLPFYYCVQVLYLSSVLFLCSTPNLYASSLSYLNPVYVHSCKLPC